MRHPEHDAIAAEVRSWYTQSLPNMGIQAEQRRYGVYRRNLKAPDYCDLVVQSLQPDAVPDFLADVRKYYGNHSVKISVYRREIDLAVRETLCAAGCSRIEHTYLVHGGEIPKASSVPGLIVELVTHANLLDYQISMLKAFGNSEAKPEPNEIESGLALRRAELDGSGCFLIARVEGEAAGVIAWYEGKDRFIFLLGTRIPFRNRGIARQLLCYVVADTYAKSCRSVLLNTNPEDTPIHLYRRMGFTDEVYWRARYTLEASDE
jgi:ribosomal protein S18 acetylase RimI-like enzyme